MSSPELIENEIKVMEALQLKNFHKPHENFLKYYGSFHHKESGYWYLVMEKASGVTIGGEDKPVVELFHYIEKMKSQPQSSRNNATKQFAPQLVSALKQMNNCGVVHRDLTLRILGTYFPRKLSMPKAEESDMSSRSQILDWQPSTTIHC